MNHWIAWAREGVTSAEFRRRDLLAMKVLRSGCHMHVRAGYRMMGMKLRGMLELRRRQHRERKWAELRQRCAS